MNDCPETRKQLEKENIDELYVYHVGTGRVAVGKNIGRYGTCDLDSNRDIRDKQVHLCLGYSINLEKLEAAKSPDSDLRTWLRI